MPAKVSSTSVRNLLCKEAASISETFKFDSVSGWVFQEHRSLFSRLAFKANVGFDDKFNVVASQSINQFAPTVHVENDSKMRNRNLVAVDRVLDRPVTRFRIDVTNQLVSEEVEVDPCCVAATFGAAEDFTVELSRFAEISHRDCEMKWRKRFSDSGRR